MHSRTFKDLNAAHITKSAAKRLTRMRDRHYAVTKRTRRLAALTLAKLGGVAHNYKLAAGALELVKNLDRMSAKRCAIGNYDGVIFHFSHLKRRRTFGAKLRQKRLGYIIELKGIAKKPFCSILITLFHLFAQGTAFGNRGEKYIVAVNGIYDSDIHRGSTTGHGGIYSCVVILEVFIFLCPCGLIGDRGGIVAFSLSLHRLPGEVRNANVYTEDSLPVALVFMTAEIKIPTGNTVHFRKHRLSAVLMDDRAALNGSVEDHIVAKEVNTGQLHTAVCAHNVGNIERCLIKSILTKHVTRQSQAVFLTPVTYVVHVRFTETLGHMGIVIISRFLCHIEIGGKEKLRQMRNKALAIASLISCGKIGSPRAHRITRVKS